MKAGVGFSDNPDSVQAGAEAVQKAIAQSGRSDACDLILLFCTSRHEPEVLRKAVSEAVGAKVPIFGGAAVGAISNDEFGYAGTQVALAMFWLDGLDWRVLVEDGLFKDEEQSGLRLGQRLAEALGPDQARDKTLLLFYNAINRSSGDLRLVMATYLLQGLERSLGFLPDVVGAGMMGDFENSAGKVFTGPLDGEAALGEDKALAMFFSDKIKIDHTIMHGCKPSTDYFTVTKTDGEIILEINNEPAIPFMNKIFGPSFKPEDYPFFLILGSNKGGKWDDFDENNYANRLCLGIDKEREGLVMFEPDMVEGTEFQVMYHSLDHEYIPPKIEDMFSNLNGRKPVFALYIDCAGRAAGYAGLETEDAEVVQKSVAGRAPLLGLYTGVEIGSVHGSPRGLDWTGVFVLFSVEE